MPDHIHPIFSELAAEQDRIVAEHQRDSVEGWIFELPNGSPLIKFYGELTAIEAEARERLAETSPGTMQYRELAELEIPAAELQLVLFRRFAEGYRGAMRKYQGVPSVTADTIAQSIKNNLRGLVGEPGEEVPGAGFVDELRDRFEDQADYERNVATDDNDRRKIQEFFDDDVNDYPLDHAQIWLDRLDDDSPLAEFVEEHQVKLPGADEQPDELDLELFEMHFGEDEVDEFKMLRMWIFIEFCHQLDKKLHIKHDPYQAVDVARDIVANHLECIFDRHRDEIEAFEFTEELTAAFAEHWDYEEAGQEQQPEAD